SGRDAPTCKALRLSGRRPGHAGTHVRPPFRPRSRPPLGAVYYRLRGRIMTLAFGGGALRDDSIVRLAYLDEAGISNLSQEPLLVVAGIAVNADGQFKAIEAHLDGLVRKHVPEERRDGLVFHAMEIFHGTKQFKREDWSFEKRLEILDDLASIPKQ